MLITVKLQKSRCTRTGVRGGWGRGAGESRSLSESLGVKSPRASRAEMRPGSAWGDWGPM